jgi:caffeoyl-CoA O-methyltransferase
MSASEWLTPELVNYLATVNPPEHRALARCRRDTAALGGVAAMQISAEQGAFMQFVARMIGARRAFEIGVFTGYSSLATALTLKEMHGSKAHLLACDISEQWTRKARGYWQDAAVDDVIDLRIAPATETMDACLKGGEAGSYDFGFVDADKVGYGAYYERGLELLRTGGVMLFDNVLWSGAVADAADQSPDTVALRALAHRARSDARVHAVMAGIGDGLLMCMKRPAAAA